MSRRIVTVKGLVSARRSARVAAVAAVGVALAACGSDTKSAVSKREFERALAHAPAPLAKLYSRSNAILDGGPPAYQRQIQELQGFPIVVNKWASWCGSCRFEFPFFQRVTKERGGSITFLAVDSEDTKTDARKFLQELPVPYPSYFDPESKIAALFKGNRVFPTTAFYDRNGKNVFTKQGAYASQAVLERDIERYAR